MMNNPKSLAFGLLCLPIGIAAAQSPAPEPPAARIAVLGASMSGGFDLLRTYKAQIDLSHIVRAALRDESPEVENLANILFFSDPLALGARQAAQARELDPTLVLAIDFPFWFGYGDGLDEEGRMQLLEGGLALLEDFDVPVAVGSFPDMRAATEVSSAYGFPMLRASQVPPPASLERLNARLSEWVAAKDTRVLVDLDSFHGALTRGEAVAVRENSWKGADLALLLLEDQLHPSVEGHIALVLLTLDALVRAELVLSEDQVVWTAEEVRERLDSATHQERERILEQERRREERRRAREEREGSGGGAPLRGARAPARQRASAA